MITESFSFQVKPEFFEMFHEGIEVDEIYDLILDTRFDLNECENFYFCAYSGTSSHLIRLKDNKFYKVHPSTFNKIIAKNREQKYLSDALADESIKCVSVTGKAGTGKTLMVLAYALAQLQVTPYRQIVITKSRVQVTDPDEEPMGEVPGTMFEKMAPQLLSYNAAFSKILGNGSGQYLKTLIDKGRIEIVPLEFMRGIDFSNKIVICDEVQNCGLSQLRTLGTRINESSRLILLGDLRQHDKNFDSDLPFSKLVMSDDYLDSPITTHIHLVKQERGPLADLFDTVL